MPLDITVLYRDDDVLVVDKPSGMVVHRGWADDGPDLLRVVRDAIGAYLFPAHRLDRGASGCTLFALNAEAARAVGDAFAIGSVGKRYLALTRGHPAHEGYVDSPVPKRPGGPRVDALTRYRRLGTAGRYALVEASPETGRLHQIRRHMKHIACPLIGDVRYGKGEHNRLFRDRYGLHRLALHASVLVFQHPSRCETVVVRAPVSGELRACIDALGLLDAANAASAGP